MTLSDEVTVSRDEDELDLSSMSIDYALNLYWHF
jgi:hypothetical protein